MSFDSSTDAMSTMYTSEQESTVSTSNAEQRCNTIAADELPNPHEFGDTPSALFYQLVQLIGSEAKCKETILSANSQAPLVSACMSVDNVCFPTVTARNKKQAKRAASVVALRTLRDKPDMLRIKKLNPNARKRSSPVADIIESMINATVQSINTIESISSSEESGEPKTKKRKQEPAEALDTEFTGASRELVQSTGKNTVQLVNEFCNKWQIPIPKYNFSNDGPNEIVTCTCEFDTFVLESTSADSKKRAKELMAAQILNKIVEASALDPVPEINEKAKEVLTRMNIPMAQFVNQYAQKNGMKNHPIWQFERDESTHTWICNCTFADFQLKATRDTDQKRAKERMLVQIMNRIAIAPLEQIPETNKFTGSMGMELSMANQPKPLAMTASTALEDAPPQLQAQVAQMISETNKNAVQLVQEYSSRRRVAKPEFNFTQDDATKMFVCTTRFMNMQIPSVCTTNKQRGKERACMHILNQVAITGGLRYLRGPVVPSKRVLDRPLSPSRAENEYQFIAAAVYTLLYQESERRPEITTTAKVVAGIVAFDENSRKAWVISWGTGSKSLSGENLRTDGTAVNDCHAEVLARRGFIRFLYKQCNDYLDGKETIFATEKAVDNRLVLKPNIRLHLFINTAPCGDGRVFSLAEANPNSAFRPAVQAPPPQTLNCDLIMKKHKPFFGDPFKHGLLRSKIEQGEGTIPTMGCAVVQTLDGITGGERLRTMSCSDKILKWNVLGLQGTLLSLFLQPIYLTSITIGTLCHHGHVARALCCRVNGLESHLPPGFHINHPIIAQACSRDTRTPKERDTYKSSQFAANWNAVDLTVEIIDGNSGRTSECPGVSRLAKKTFFDEYKNLCQHLKQLNWIHPTYSATKAEVYAYKQAKESFYSYLQNARHGHWLPKPREEKLFQ